MSTADEPVVVGLVLRRLGEQGGRTFFELDQWTCDGPWQVAVDGELLVGSRIAAYGYTPAEAVVYAERVEYLT